GPPLPGQAGMGAAGGAGGLIG
ncbi:hypothetical protein, partial [Mycobacterium tuberculosis]